ncbi:VC0807 family protein [Streptosporangium lutulentum]|uniref:Intracellular septation protein A n=1 Tax=Streptosporangium lutulentum TaxID=1461250 RepID=A0ABT9QEH2_9ACTN|nr:VC0807 family protein [Streptosporangium lutulentum]MDP9845069.1 intracellular septation protein A [Streptosporangium lutulentum]
MSRPVRQDHQESTMNQPGTRTPQEKEMNRSGRSGIISVVLWDVAPMIVVYYGCRALGVSEYVSMLTAASAGFLRVAYVALRQRRFDGFAAFMGTLFGVGLVLSLLAGDERFLMAVKSVTTSVAGLIFLGTCVAGRPAAFAVAKLFGAENADTVRRWEALYAAEPAFRRVYLVMTVVWGVVLLAESAARIPLIYLLPADVMVGLSSILLIGTIGLLALWSSWYGKRGEQAAQRFHSGPEAVGIP